MGNIKTGGKGHPNTTRFVLDNGGVRSIVRSTHYIKKAILCGRVIIGEGTTVQDNVMLGHLETGEVTIG